MIIQQTTAPHRALSLSLLAFAAGLSLWAVFGSASHLPLAHGTFSETAAQCIDADDIVAFQDRSRNGISLTCNSHTLNRSVGR